MLPIPFSRSRRERSRGQSLVEFALVVPVLLLLTLLTIDFGRVYLGWINLQNMARIAANYAANNPEAWGTPGDPAKQIRYRQIISNDAKVINCDLTGSGSGGLRDPIFRGTGLGGLAEAYLGCRFTVITPVISQIVGGSIGLEASAVSPVRIGVVSGVGGGGGPTVAAPEAAFIASPSEGFKPLIVQFTDASLNQPTSWTWNFGDGTTLYDRDPVHRYETAGTYTVTLTVQNSGGFDSESTTITVVDPPATGPIPEFTASPLSGTSPLTVRFTDQSTGTITDWRWTFEDDGSQDSAANPTHTFTDQGSWDVTLEVSEDGGVTWNEQVKRDYILVDAVPCRVPNFFNTKKNSAQARWTAEGFTTNVQFAAGSGNYTIQTQTLAAGTVPAAGCDATIRVGP